jgi:hypothetical protein
MVNLNEPKVWRHQPVEMRKKPRKRQPAKFMFFHRKEKHFVDLFTLADVADRLLLACISFENLKWVHFHL